MADTLLTENNDIRAWIEAQDGVPAVIRGAEEEEEEHPDVLHISFDPTNPDMQRISWDEFFERLERENLALLVDEKENGTNGKPKFSFVDKTAKESELEPGEELPDSGDVDELKGNITPDIH